MVLYWNNSAKLFYMFTNLIFAFVSMVLYLSRKRDGELKISVLF